MRPLEVAAGAVVLLAVLVLAGRLVAARRRGNLRRREEVERGTDDAGVRAEVLERLGRETATWHRAGVDPTENRPVRPEPPREDHHVVNPPGPEPARHGRPGRRIGVRRRPHA